jgi:hypothetical protein
MKNNNITKEVDSISYEEALEKEIKWLKNEIYGLVNERNALVKTNQQLHDKLDALRYYNLQLLEHIGLMHDNKTCQYTMILSPADAALVRELTVTKVENNMKGHIDSHGCVECPEASKGEK